eukprot:Rmarinus@m.25174
MTAIDTIKESLQNRENWPRLGLYFAQWLFAIIVFGGISDGAKDGDACFYGASENNPDGEEGACGWGIFVGVMSFLIAMFEVAALLINMTAMVPKAGLVRLAVNALFCFFWFVTGCYLASEAKESCDEFEGITDKSCSEVDDSTDFKYNSAIAAVVFSFFSWILWIVSTFWAYKVYNLNDSLEGSGPNSLQTPGASGFPDPLAEDKANSNPVAYTPPAPAMAPGSV